MKDSVTSETKCAECGYSYIYADSRDPWPRCGSTIKHHTVSIQTGVHLSSETEVEIKKEQTKFNKKLVSIFIIIFIISAILSFLFSQPLIFIIGIILDTIGSVVGYYAIQKTIERRIISSR